MAYRIADRILAGAGITKAAGGAYAAQRDAHAAAWMPFADVMVTGSRDIARRLDENLQILRGIYEADQARKAARAQAFDMTVRGAGEPHATVPYDPELMRLHANLGPHRAPPRVNGHGAAAPEGGQ